MFQYLILEWLFQATQIYKKIDTNLFIDSENAITKTVSLYLFTPDEISVD